MKIFNRRKIASFVTATALAAMVLVQLSCEDNSLNAGDYDAPISLSGVRYASPDSAEEVTQIGPGDVVALNGTNMDAVAHVYFNGYEATFNPTLTTKDHLVVTVPSDMPFGEMEPDAYYMNTIKITNSTSKDSLEFQVQPPAPKVSGISNEYAAPGDLITITGQYLYLVTDVTFPGDIAADLSTVNSAADGTWMKVEVPDGATTEGDIIVTSTAGPSPASVSAEFLQTEGMICNFDDLQNWEWWSAQSTSDATNFPGARGNFALMSTGGGEISSGDNSWWNAGRSINLSQGMQWIDPADVGEALGNFAIKFELAINGTWNTGTLLMRTENSTYTYRARYEPWRTSNGVVPVEYEGWRTVTIPFNMFKTFGEGVDGGGTTVPNLAAILPNGQAPYPGIMLYNDLEGVIPVDLQFGIDNIRVVRIAE